jgi:hypothetical protein
MEVKVKKKKFNLFARVDEEVHAFVTEQANLYGRSISEYLNDVFPELMAEEFQTFLRNRTKTKTVKVTTAKTTKKTTKKKTKLRKARKDDSNTGLFR